jgi:hypothetical protein
MTIVASIGLARTLGLAHARALFLLVILLAVGACALMGGIGSESIGH